MVIRRILALENALAQWFLRGLSEQPRSFVVFFMVVLGLLGGIVSVLIGNALSDISTDTGSSYTTPPAPQPEYHYHYYYYPDDHHDTQPGSDPAVDTGTGAGPP